VILPEHADRLVLLVSGADSKARYVKRYLEYGEKTTFSSGKSKAVTVPKRSTCKAREPWYDLTKYKRGQLIWSKAHHYRHIAVYNSEKYVVNCRLYDVFLDPSKTAKLLAAICNSTLTALFKTFYGRYTGTEGNLETMVVDLALLEIPDPRIATPEVAANLVNAFDRLCQRDTLPMVEEEFIACRSSERAAKLNELPIGAPAELRTLDRRDLDLAVFELIGVTDSDAREKLCDELYFEPAKHFREIRIVEIKKQEQRAKSEGRGFRIDELAVDIWDALTDHERLPIVDWVGSNFAHDWPVTIPDGNPKLPDFEDMLDAATVFFSSKKGTRAARLTCPTRAHAEVIYQLCKLGIRGDISLPNSAENLAAELSRRLSSIDQRVDELARSRSTDESRIEDLAALLKHWMILGKPKHT
jgi:hypothetical protein